MKLTFPGNVLGWMLLAISFSIAVTFPARADDEVTERFEAANLLYEKGDFGGAARAYESLIADGVRAPAILFNAGNARYKMEEVGMAVAHWLQAEAIDPRNDRIQINLEFARKELTGGTLPVPLWPEQLRWLTVDEWAAASLVSGWLFFGALALGTLKPKLRAALRMPAVMGGVLLIATTSLLAITVRDRVGSVVAVVVAEEAVVRFGPLSESQSTFVARSGAEFRVTDRKDAWLKVEDALGREGWLLGNQVIQLRAGRVIDDRAVPEGGDTSAARIAGEWPENPLRGPEAVSTLRPAFRAPVGRLAQW
jgi:hypothetical protein